MGRIGETIARTWQLASHMKEERGSLPEDAGSGNDNTRIKRYVAKYTVNAARIFGIDHEIGSLEVGKLADVVLWEPKFFGIKPEVVFKGGFPAWSRDGRVERIADDLRAASATGLSGARTALAKQSLSGHLHGTGRDRRRRARSARSPQAVRRATRHAFAHEARPALE